MLKRNIKEEVKNMLNFLTDKELINKLNYRKSKILYLNKEIKIKQLQQQKQKETDKENKQKLKGFEKTEKQKLKELKQLQQKQNIIRKTYYKTEKQKIQNNRNRKDKLMYFENMNNFDFLKIQLLKPTITETKIKHILNKQNIKYETETEIIKQKLKEIENNILLRNSNYNYENAIKNFIKYFNSNDKSLNSYLTVVKSLKQYYNLINSDFIYNTLKNYSDLSKQQLYNKINRFLNRNKTTTEKVNKVKQIFNKDKKPLIVNNKIQFETTTENKKDYYLKPIYYKYNLKYNRKSLNKMPTTTKKFFMLK